MDTTLPETPAPSQPAPGYQPPARSRAGWIVAAVIAVILLLMLGSCVAFVVAVSSTGRGTSAPGGNGIALIHLNGTISDGGANPQGPNPERMVELLVKADKDPSIKAVLLRINSPGGTVSASQEIAMQVRRMHKPVLADIGDTGASGAYYVASQSTEIMSTPNSAVGSIGVVLEIPNVQELMKKLGISVTVIHEGTFKDIGSPFRPMTPVETQILAKDLKPAYDQFIADVARGRKLPVAKVRSYATGLVWPGMVAKDMGLVDKLGNYQDAVDEAARLGGIKGEPQVVDYDQTDVFGTLGRLLGAAESLRAPEAAALDRLKGSVAR